MRKSPSCSALAMAGTSSTCSIACVTREDEKKTRPPSPSPTTVTTKTSSSSSDDSRSETSLREQAGIYVKRQQRRFLKHTRLPPNPDLLKIEWGDFELQEKLGHGAFSTVHSIKLKDQEYAIKMERIKKKKSDSYYKVAAAALVCESLLLSRLSHPNIMKVVAVKAGKVKDSVQGEGYFMVMPKLQGTLMELLVSWRKLYKSKLVWKKKAVPSLSKRLETALEIASGMAHLHQHRIVYRDLKPQNVGFDNEGNAVLFDLGVAQELDVDSTTYWGGRTLDCTVGTFRYMAPEVYSSSEYGLPCDVYSFGLILWSLVTLKIPFHHMTKREMQVAIRFHRARPPTDRIKSTRVANLIESCWDQDPAMRPTFEQIKTILQHLATKE